MTKFKNSWGIHMRGCWLENSLRRLEGRWRVRGGSGYKAGNEMGNNPHGGRGLHMGRYPLNTCFVTEPTLTPSPFFQSAQIIFDQTFSLWVPQLFSNLVVLHLLAYEDGTECSETSAYKIQTPGNYPEENIQHTEHGKCLKSRKLFDSLVALEEGQCV
jgi:hypothetical protein